MGRDAPATPTRDGRSESRAGGLGLRAIVAYKLAKSGAELILGAALLLLHDGRFAERLRVLAETARTHAVEAWSIALANLLLRATSSKHLELIAAASILDGLLSFLEGWTLRQRHQWGHWLVIVATSALLPFEVARLLRGLTIGRAIILLANAAIVWFLAHRLISEKARVNQACAASSSDKIEYRGL